MLFCVFYGEEQWHLSPLNAQNNVNGIGAKGREHVFDESDPAMMAVQERLVRRIVAELRDCDNVYFELCNEPYFDGPALGSPWNERMMRVIREVSGRHLIALNVANGSQRVEQMPQGLAILNFHYCAPPDAVAMNWQHVVAQKERVARRILGPRGRGVPHGLREDLFFPLQADDCDGAGLCLVTQPWCSPLAKMYLLGYIM